MKTTATITELAAASNKHETTIRRQLNKKGSPFTYRQGPGGPEKHFIISLLPKKLRLALASGHVKKNGTKNGSLAAQAGSAAAKQLLTEEAEKKELAQMAKEDGLAAYERLPEKRKAEAKARFSFLLASNEFTAALGIKLRRYAKRSKKADLQFVDEYNGGRIQLDESVTEVIGETTSYSTLRRLFTNYDRYGLAGLANGYCNPKRGNTSLTTEEQDEVVKTVLKNPRTSVRNIRRALLGRFRREVPSDGVIRRFRKRWIKENSEFFLYLTNPDEWKNKRMLAFGSASEHIERLNQLWEADSTPADLMLTDGRHSLIGMIDVYSRRMKFFVSKTSRATSVVALIRLCLIEWGVPEIIKTDNGKDYISQHVVRVIDGLEIEQQLCTPFQGQEKPHMERGFKTFLHGLVELMPNYIGHNVAERVAIRARRSFADRVMGKGSDPVEVNMSSKELQKFCDQWTHWVYNQDVHGSLNNKTPMDMVRNWRRPISRIHDLRALDMLLMPAPRDGGKRTIRKKGVLVEGRYYKAKEFAGKVGEKVFVLLDPADMGTAYIYLINDYDEREFLCPAIDPLWTGINLAEFSVRARKYQTKLMREKKKELSKQTRNEGKDLAYQDYVDYRRSQVENIVDFPNPSEEHSTPALDQASLAVASMDELNAPDQPVSLSTDDEAAAAKFLEETEPEKTGNTIDAKAVFEQKQLDDAENSGWQSFDGWERFEYLQKLTRLTESQQKWIEYYKTTSEYKTLQDIYEDEEQAQFGP